MRSSGCSCTRSQARRSVYIESQYFASRKIAEAIAKRLQEVDGPEFVIINPTTAEGWLEAVAMDTARARLMKALQQVDGHGRLAMYCPFTAGGAPIYVHAKIMVVDGESIRVGSANFNNRSMRLDSECDVLVSGANHDGVRTAAVALRDGLIAEHLGIGAGEVGAEIEELGMIAAIEKLRGDGRSLRPYQLPDVGEVSKWLADNELLDPEGPEEMFEPLTKRGLFRRRKRLLP